MDESSHVRFLTKAEKKPWIRAISNVKDATCWCRLKTDPHQSPGHGTPHAVGRISAIQEKFKNGAAPSGCKPDGEKFKLTGKLS